MDMSWMETPLSELDITPHNETPAGTIKPIRLKGVSRYDGHTFRIFTTADGLAYDTVKDIVEDKTGTLWFATGFGVSQYDGENFDNLTLNGPMGMQVLPESWNDISAIAQDTAGNFWFATACRYQSTIMSKRPVSVTSELTRRFYAFSGDGGRSLLDT